MSAVKKGFKKAFKWVKKNFKYIVIAAAIIFTAGIATVGVAGFSAASAAAGGGLAGTLSAAGSTMVAGMASIGATVGLGSGVTATTAGGAFATAPVMSGLAAGSGLSLGTGAAAQSLGLAASTAATTSYGQAGYGVLANSAGAGSAGAAGAGAAGAAAAPTWNGAAQFAAASTAPTTAAAGGAASLLAKPATGMLLQAGMGLVNGYMQGRAEEEQWDREKPKGYWGVGLNGLQDAQGSTFPGGNGGLMWNANSFDRPTFNNFTPSAAGQTGNAALDGGATQDPNVSDPLNPNYDPTAAQLGDAYVRH